MTETRTRTRIGLLGGFSIDGEPQRWAQRRAAELVQLLALADGHRLARDQVIEALWPTLGRDAGAANLRKAAHHARRELDDPDAVVLGGGHVTLFGHRTVTTDAAAFEAAPTLEGYAGDLLPDARYEAWAQAPRERLRGRYLDLLRREGRWERLAELEPTDEGAHRELMREALEAGSRPAAIRWYGRLRTALRRGLGLPPSPETVALYDLCVAGLEHAAPAFVGRALELARAAAALRVDDVGAVVLRGPGGIGKTALASEIGRTARAGGWTVVSTAATAAGGPYAPLAEVGERLAAYLSELTDEARTVLGQLAAPAATDSLVTRHRVIGAVRRLLLAAAGPAGVLLVVDDAHLADEATIDVLQHIGSAGGTPVALVLAYRPEAAPETLRRGVARLSRAGRATELDIEPLAGEEAVALVAAAAPAPRSEETVERIVALAQGNPFLTLELARSAVVGVPALAPTVRDAVAARFLDADADTLAALRRLALTGDALDPGVAVAALGGDEAVAFATLDAALATGVLVVAGGGYRFGHELVRQALVDQLAPHERLALHRVTAERLEGTAAPAQVAEHWIAGGRPREAVPHLLDAAAQAVALGAYADALDRLAPLLEHEPEHAAALRLRAEALDARGDAAAPAAYMRAADVGGGPEADDLRARGALAQVKLGDAPGGLGMAAGLVPTTLHGKIAHALAHCGAAALGFGDPAVGTAKAAEVRRLAFQSGDPAAIQIASWAQAAVAHARGELRDSVRADLRETSALHQLAVNAFDGQLCITQRLLYGARPYEDVIAFADSLEAEAARLGAVRGRAFATTIRGEARLLAGDLDGAEADLLEGARRHREIAGATGEAFSLQRRAEVAMHRGQRAQAIVLLDEALAIARESDVGFHLFDRIYGTRIALAETPAEALAALEEAESAVRGPVETCPGCRITLAVPATIAALRAGDRGRAAAWGPVAEYLVDVVMRLPAWYAAHDEIKAHRALMDGDSDAAREHFAKAAAGYAAAGHPVDEARCARGVPQAAAAQRGVTKW